MEYDWLSMPCIVATTALSWHSTIFSRHGDTRRSTHIGRHYWLYLYGYVCTVCLPFDHFNKHRDTRHTTYADNTDCILLSVLSVFFYCSSTVCWFICWFPTVVLLICPVATVLSNSISVDVWLHHNRPCSFFGHTWLYRLCVCTVLLLC